MVKEYFSSNTTLVKVKFPFLQSVLRIQQVQIQHLLKLNVITISPALKPDFVQIQHLLKLNAQKINLYDFHYTIKSIDIQGF